MTLQSPSFGPPLPPEKQNVLPRDDRQNLMTPAAVGQHPHARGPHAAVEMVRTWGAADVVDGAVAGLTLGQFNAVRRNVGGVVAVRDGELDIVVLADEALVRDGLARAMDGAGGADEGSRDTSCGGRKGGKEGKQSEDLHVGATEVRWRKGRRK